MAAGVYVTFAVQFDDPPAPGEQVVPDTAPTVPWAGLVTAKVNASPFASVPASAITSGVSSVVVTLWALATGAVFPIATVTVAAVEFNAPSLTRKVKLSEPVKFRFGVYVTLAVQLDPDPLGVQVVPVIVPTDPFAGFATTLKVSAALSMSAPDNVTGIAVFFAVETDVPVAVGASLTAVIVIKTVATAEVNAPSLVENVKLSGPL